MDKMALPLSVVPSLNFIDLVYMKTYGLNRVGSFIAKMQTGGLKIWKRMRTGFLNRRLGAIHRLRTLKMKNFRPSPFVRSPSPCRVCVICEWFLKKDFFKYKFEVVTVAL